MSSLTIFPRAPVSLVLRAWDRNSAEVDSIESRISAVCRDWLGGAFAATHDRKIQFAAEVLYFGVTLLLNRSTLGEEQSGLTLASIATTNASSSPRLVLRPPSRIRLFISYLCHLFVPHLLRKLFERFFPEHDASDGVRRVLLAHVAWWWLWSSNSTGGISATATMTSGAGAANNNNRAISASWTPESVSARLSGLTSVSTDTRMYNAAVNSSAQYSFLGGLTLLRLAVETAIWARERWRNRNAAAEVAAAAASGATADGTAAVDAAAAAAAATEQQQQQQQQQNAAATAADNNIDRGVCPLCLEQRTHPTAVTCGHVFCWSCLSSLLSAEAGGAEPRCPLCREVVRPQGFVLLKNFAVPRTSSRNE